jgi:hypothetical protein
LFVEGVAGAGEPGDDGGVDPVGLADEGARGGLLLVEEAAAGVEEPEDEERGGGGGAAVGVDWEVVVGDTRILVEDHLVGEAIAVEALAAEDVSAGEVEGAVVVAVSGCPREVAFDDRSNDLVDVVGGVVLVGVFARDQVAVQDDELLLLRVQDFVEDVDRVEVLLMTPLIPSI